MTVMGHRVLSRVRQCALFAALVIGVPQVARAHGRLKATSPGAGAQLSRIPRELRLEFSEVTDLTFSNVTLTGHD